MKEARWKAAFPGNFVEVAHIGGQVLTSEGQTCSLGTAFTTTLADHWRAQSQLSTCSLEEVLEWERDELACKLS